MGGGQEATTATATTEGMTKKRLSRLWKRGTSSSGSGNGQHSKDNRRRRGKGGRMAEEAMVPIACSTKRTESVLAENYLFPIEVGGKTTNNNNNNNNKVNEGMVDGGGVANGVGLLKRPRRSIFSLGLKTKIGPMDLGLGVKKSSGAEGLPPQQQINNNNNNTLSSVYGGDQKLQPEKKKHSESLDTTQEVLVIKGGFVVGEELKTSKDFEMVPTIDAPQSGSVEAEALRLLNNWGITATMLVQAMPSGARSELMGIYRIVVHRLQMQEERRLMAAAVQQTKEKDVGRGKTKKSTDRDGGGGCGGRCSGTSSNCVIL